jgi:hypothetical protein
MRPLRSSGLASTARLDDDFFKDSESLFAKKDGQDPFADFEKQFDNHFEMGGYDNFIRHRMNG